MALRVLVEKEKIITLSHFLILAAQVSKGTLHSLMQLQPKK